MTRVHRKTHEKESLPKKSSIDSWVDLSTRTEYHEKGHRCSICNCVNIVDIETDLGDYRDKMSFTTDPSNSDHFICIDCAEAIQDIRDDYLFAEELKDENEG